MDAVWWSRRRPGSSTSATARSLPLAIWINRVIDSVMRGGSLDHFEFCQGCFVYGEAQAGQIIVEVHETVFGFGLSIEDIPEKFVADFDVHDGEIFGHGGIQAGHYDVIVVHLSGVGNYRDGIRFGERCDLSGL